MVLCEEVLQWLTGHHSSAQVGGATTTSYPDASVSDSPSAAPATPQVASVAAPALRTTASGKHAEGSREWTLLQQLSHELGKNLGDHGSRSSPLSPSDLAGSLRAAPPRFQSRLRGVCSAIWRIAFTHPYRPRLYEHFTSNSLRQTQQRAIEQIKSQDERP